jgi:hypothetical protein
MTKYRGKKQHREVHPKIFVWSHTAKAEIEYFQDFKNHLRTPLLMPQKNICWTPQELLEKVIKWKIKNICEKDGDQVWCIFDIDDFYDDIDKNGKHTLMTAIKNAIQNNIKIAYANECFELWILVHFQKTATPIKRGNKIEKKIQEMFKKHKLPKFTKNQKVFDLLLPFQSNAIKNAKTVLADYAKINWDEKISKKGNPSTSIHFLVDEINTLIGNR